MDTFSSTQPLGKLYVIRMLKVLLVLGLATLALGLVGTKPASAQAMAAVSTEVSETTCSLNASKTYLSTGAKIRMYEGGMSGVEQFRVKFMLYEMNPQASEADAPEKSRTYESEYFGSNDVNHSWEASHTFRSLPATGQYVLRVKFIFVGAPSSNWTTDARICNNTKGGYVGDKYYAPPTK